MNELKLDYFKDTEDNYIIHRAVYDPDFEGDYIITSGDYKENIILGSKNLKKKIKHRLDSTVQDLRKIALSKNYMFKKDIVSEKFTAKVIPEEEYNPLFQYFSKQEAAKYTKDSTKIRIEIHYEIHFVPKSHIWLGSFLTTLKKY